MTSHFKASAFLRWLCLLLVVVVILAMSPGAVLAAAKPGAPTGLTATGGNKQVSLSWTAPASDGGDPITDYRVQYREAGSLTWVTYPDGGGNATAATVKLLTNGTPYEFRVKAKNSVGLGAASNVASATPGATGPTKPGSPRNLTATPGNKKVTLNWDPPSSDGGAAITDYKVQYRKVGALTWRTFPDGGGTATTATVKPLANGIAYEFRVKAKTSAGLGAASNVASATPGATGPSVPGAPTGLTATGGDGQVALDWDAPYNGGEPITDYRVQYREAGALTWRTYPDGTSDISAATVRLLTNGVPYEFQVRALNSIGWGPPSNIASATPNEATAPGAPLNLTATPGNHQVALDWDAPSDGGSAITDYVVQYCQGAGCSNWTTFPDGGGTATAATVTSLTNGTLYQFRVQAVNGEGGGPWATTSATPANPATVPGIPLNLHGVSPYQSDRVNLDWDVPSSDGGSPITDYDVQYQRCTLWILTCLNWSGSTFFEGGTSDLTQMTVTGLQSFSLYRFAVRAENAVGPGAWSNTAYGFVTWQTG